MHARYVNPIGQRRSNISKLIIDKSGVTRTKSKVPRVTKHI